MVKKAWTLFIIVKVLFYSGNLFAIDDLSDAKFEKRIHNMYKSKTLEPVGDDEWSAFLDRVESETYSVRKGDTLWGLSAAFFGDGLYWPKIWSLNDRITNPHLIYPSAEIRFFSGTIEKPPGIQVVGSENPDDVPLADPGQEAIPQEDGYNSDAAPVNDSQGEDSAGVSYDPIVGLYPGAPRIPPSRTKITPVSGIPPAFETSSFSIEKYDESGVSFDLRPAPPVASNLLAHTFFYEGKVRDYPSVGSIIELEHGQESTGFGGFLYLETDDESAVGTVYTVISEDFSQKVNGIRGTVFRYAGEVKVVAALGSTRYRAIVTSALFPVLKGAILTKEMTPSFDDGVQNTNSEKFEIQGGAYNKRRDLFGEGSVIFINGGTQEGVKVGDVFGIYKNRSVRYKDAQVEQSPLPIAAIKVFRTGENTSSAMILSASEPVWVKDTTGRLKVGSLNISSDEREDIDTLENQLDTDSESPDVESDGETLTEGDIADFPEEDDDSNDDESIDEEDFGDEDFDDDDLGDDSNDSLENSDDEVLDDAAEDDLGEDDFDDSPDDDLGDDTESEGGFDEDDLGDDDLEEDLNEDF